MSHPTRVAQVRNLDGYDIDPIIRLVRILGFHRVGATQIHVGYVVREYVPTSMVSLGFSEM
jgi:hypothetical protein